MEFDKQQVRIEYTVPVKTASGLTDTTEVRCIGKSGTPGRIRTRDPLLRRQPLYPLSYWGTGIRSSHAIAVGAARSWVTMAHECLCAVGGAHPVNRQAARPYSTDIPDA